MSLFESGDSTGDISLEKICNGKLESAITKEIKLEDLIYYVVRGGWPGNLSSKREKAGLLPKAYVRAVLDEDIDRVDGIKRDKKKDGKTIDVPCQK